MARKSTKTTDTNTNAVKANTQEAPVAEETPTPTLSPAAKAAIAQAKAKAEALAKLPKSGPNAAPSIGQVTFLLSACAGLDIDLGVNAEVAPAHELAAAELVATYSGNLRDPERTKRNRARDFAHLDALVEAGVTAQQVSAALDRFKRIKNRKDMSPVAKASSFLTALAFEPAGYVPSAAETTAAPAGLFAPAAPQQTAAAPQHDRQVTGSNNLKALADSLRAQGLDEDLIAKIIASKLG